MNDRFSIIIDILTTHSVDSLIINGRILAVDSHNMGYEFVDITDWTYRKIKYDLLNY